jgi:AcrR family transcriptional regulator
MLAATNGCINRRRDHKLISMAPRPKAKRVARIGPPPSARHSRAGGRSARIVAEVLRATAEELARVGYAALRMEEVARAAGVNKTTVYRRWPTKVELVTEAMLHERERRSIVPDTGSLRDDLRVMLHAFVESGRTPLARAWLSELGNPEVRRIMHGSRHHFESQWTTVLARGMARGELPAGASPVFLMEVLVAPVVGRLVRGEELPTDEFCADVIELVLTGAGAH